MSTENIDSACSLPIDSYKNDSGIISDIFEQWIHCICVVTFDLEFGQAMEVIYPSTTKLTEKEKVQICYMAFPDSNSGLIGDTQYHFRFRMSKPKLNITTNELSNGIDLNFEQIKFSRNCLETQKPEFEHFWGFVYFRQKKDKNIPRGYFQKSFIILTRLPLFNLFYDITSKIAPIYFNITTISNNPKQINVSSSSSSPKNPQKNKIDCNLENFFDNKKLNQTDNLNTNEINVGENFLNDIYDEINLKWPKLSEASRLTTVNLKLFDNLYKIQMPSKNLKKLKINSSKLDDNNSSNLFRDNLLTTDKFDNDYKFGIPIVCGELNIFKIFKYFVKNLITLWELVILGEPILVCANSPTECSLMVQSLVSIIQPLTYNAEYRPYFTIHDSEFKEFTNNFSQPIQKKSNFNTSFNKNTNSSGKIKDSIILGVTNPFFFKLLNNFPNIIKLPDMINDTDENYFIGQTDNNFKLTNCDKIGNFIRNTELDNSNGVLNSNSLQKTTIDLKNFSNDTSNLNLDIDSEIVMVEMDNNCGIDSNNIIKTSKNSSTQPTFLTSYKPMLKQDKDLIEKIQCGIKTKRPERIQSILVRRKFLELTQSFIIPLERYIASLMPLQKDIKLFNKNPQPQNFDCDEFLGALHQFGPQLTTEIKGDWKGLYRKFFQSPNFWGWYQKRYQELQKRLILIQLEELSDFDLFNWSKQRRECEIIDMILKIKQKLNLLFCNEIKLNGTIKCSDKNLIIGQNKNFYYGYGIFKDLACNKNYLKNFSIKTDDGNVINNKILNTVEDNNCLCDNCDDESTEKFQIQQKIIEKINLFINTLPDDLQQILLGTYKSDDNGNL